MIDDEMTALARLGPAILEPLYRMGWGHLKPIQVRAIERIFTTDGDLIVAARTAAGKTEAAFLPILARVAATPEIPGIRAVYAGPLKALINDQFARLERLCEAAAIPVHRWHGDVDGAAKARLLDAPAGVLLITPESIESLLVNHASRLARAFGGLSYVAIDEMHAFLADERGAQLKSVLARLSHYASGLVRLVGLSATLGDPDAARRWLRPRDPGRVALVEDAGGSQEIKIKVSAFVNDSDEPDEALMAAVVASFRGRRALIFGESKRRLEECAAFAAGVAEGFQVHHGSLSRSGREEAEAALRSERPTATFCTSTLEMGIDVGDVESVGQVGPPGSVASLVQRAGRSGRKAGRPRVLRVFLDEATPEPEAPLGERIGPDLLRAVASVELLLLGWCEPPEADRLHLSTLVQQALGLIAERGGLKADALFKGLVTDGAFVGVDPKMFASVLRSLKAADLVDQDPEGAIVLGLVGEKVVRSFDFYAAFASTEALAVVAEGRDLGRVAYGPTLLADGRLLLAGRSWRVVSVDRRAGRIEVVPGEGGKVPPSRSSGLPDVHPRLAATTRDLLRSESTPAYLDPVAASLLAGSRALARESGILAGEPVDDARGASWFPWTGTRVLRTMRGLGEHALGIKVREVGASLHFPKSRPADVALAYRRLLDDAPTAESLAATSPDLAREKYDPYLPPDLLALAFARERLDLPGALASIRSSLSPPADPV